MKVGVLALQGAVDIHRAMLEELGAATKDVRTPRDLADIDGIVIPGGESTTISMLLDSSGLFYELNTRLHDGMPALGTCAGMIMLADSVLDGRPDQRTFGMVDLDVRRNAYGRQVDSFEADLVVDGLDGGPFHGIFIRAPAVERVGDEVEVLAQVDDQPVLCRQDSVLVASFHPELGSDPRLHALYLESL